MLALFAVLAHLFGTGAFAHWAGTVVQQPYSQALRVEAMVASGQEIHFAMQADRTGFLQPFRLPLGIEFPTAVLHDE